MNLKSRIRINLRSSYFYFVSFAFSLGFSFSSFASHTPNTGVNWSMDNLVAQSQGAVVSFAPNIYTFKDNVIIAEKDTLSIGSTDILVFDCTSTTNRLTIAGTLKEEDGCSSIIADKPILSVTDLDTYQKYPGVIYDDLGIRRRANPKIRSNSTSMSIKISAVSPDTESIIQGTITDASTGKSLPVRVSIRKSDGQYVCDTDCAGNYVNYYLLPGFWVSDGTFECTVC